MIKLSALYTDFYELTMAQGFFLYKKKDDIACFDYFVRKNPYNGGYIIFAGLDSFLTDLENFTFSDEDIEFLKHYNFKKEFLDYLKNFKFTGRIYSFEEGDVVFPNEPIMRIEGPIIECQIIESFLLNYLNFQSLIATKTRRIVDAADGRPVIDFGLRRAQGLGAIHASRAAYIGGAIGTSNTLAGKIFNIPVKGTHAHSWVQSFPNEYEAFKAFANTWPDNAILLIDTYDTLRSGLPNAIKVAKELEKNGHRLFGVRLDSGDFAYLSKKVRKILDENGLRYVKIIVSNQLDEYTIKSLLTQNAPIDGFGVGTRLITSYDQPALDGVYKLCSLNNIPKIKISENIEKVNNPGIKKVRRYLDENGNFLIDGVLLKDEKRVKLIRHPVDPYRKTEVINYKFEEPLKLIFENGKKLVDRSIEEIRNFSLERFKKLPEEHKRFINPHVYRVGLSNKLWNLRDILIKENNRDYVLIDKDIDALFIVDMQNDFCPGGALPVKDGDKIVPVINKLMKKFEKIYASKDWHPENTAHFSKWPVHCVRNTKGAEFHKDLKVDLIKEVFLKGTSKKDDGYSAFEATNKNLNEFLKSQNVKRLFICGLALDYCVKATAIDSLKNGFETFIILDATKAVTEDKKELEKLLEDLKKQGIYLITSDKII